MNEQKRANIWFDPFDDPDHRADRAEVAPGNPEHFEHKSSREKRHE